MTPCDRPTSNLWCRSSGPRVLEFRHSVIITASVPATSNAPYVRTVSRVCTDHRLPRRSRRRRTSAITGKPSPPTTTAAMIGKRMNGSVAKPIRLSLYSANPALLYAEIAWNTPRYNASQNGSSYLHPNRTASSSATAASITKLSRMTPATTWRTSPRPRAFVSACAKSCIRIPSRRATRRASTEAIVITPMPPIWISARMTPSPNPDQYVDVSTTTSPVTQIAETAVNNAVPSPVRSPLSEATGSISRMVPTTVASANPATTTRPGRRHFIQSSLGRDPSAEPTEEW